MVRVDRAQYPEIIQAARWMDEDNGTPHFEPGVGFVVDDPDGLTVPSRWVPHLDRIEEALRGLDHEKPHPLDADTIEWLAREGKQPTLFESAVRCFVSGEHTPMTAMQHSSEALWIAGRFFNERFEGWEFDPAGGFAAPATADTHPDDKAVDLFATRMKAKLAAARGRGRGGWDDPAQCSTDYLRQLLHEHVAKGDPVDVANFCMMLAHYGASTSPATADTVDVGEVEWRLISEDTSWVDGRDVVLLAHGMEVSARFCRGEWSDDTPISPAEYSGAVWSCFDDQFQFEIEEISHDPARWGHGPVTHWRAALRTPPQPETGSGA